ncbi:MarR family winged helix-turn-helix transcriptional regulator [Streptomyces mirabilis]|uniref:MarR family winged helix-turn-helix transcriptional regulator n=1 Tax=Streptomyces mirabilis TaxID=68239 RepID=UPI003683BF1C
MDDTDSLTERWAALNRFHHEIEMYLERLLHEHISLSFRELHALTSLAHHTRASSRHYWLRAIAKEVGLSQSATSRLMSRLQERGMITTRTSRYDGRSVDVRLTGEAEQLITRAGPLLDQAVSDAVASLSAANASDHRLLRFLMAESPARPAPAATIHNITN